MTAAGFVFDYPFSNGCADSMRLWREYNKLLNYILFELSGRAVAAEHGDAAVALLRNGMKMNYEWLRIADYSVALGSFRNS